MSLINAAAKGNPVKLSLQFRDLLPLILQDFQSPLAAPQLSKLFLELRKTVFFEDLVFLGELIAIVTIRLYKPQCDLDPNWEHENLTKAMVRVVDLIHEKTVPKKNEEYSPETLILTVPAFSYTFPLLKLSLSSNYAKNHDEFIFDGLQIISEHAKTRGTQIDPESDIYHPKHLPTKQMFLLLVDIICNSSGRVQAQSEACLLDIARSVSGKQGCGIAILDEVDVLLTALQSSISVARDAALRALIIVAGCLPRFEMDYKYALKLNKRIWIARFDDVDENRKLAKELWVAAKMEFPAKLTTELMPDIEHPVECVQTAAAKALAALLETDRAQVEPTIKTLLQLYSDRLKVSQGIIF